MPRGDGTGPGGLGPRTGRAAGYCTGSGVPGFANPVPGRGYWGGGRGGGWGYRNRFYATGLNAWQRAGYGASYFPVGVRQGMPFSPSVSRDQELDALKSQAEYLKDTLEGVKKRIDELENQSK